MSAENPPPKAHAALRAMAHDLTNPLSAISGFLQLMVGPRAKDPITPHQESMLTHMERSCVHALGLLRDVADLSRLEEGHPTAPMSADAVPLFRRAVSEYLSLAERRRITLSLETPDTLPPVGVDLYFFPRALDALLRTAGRLTHDGGAIVVRLGTDQGGLSGTLTHTGDAVSPKDWEHIVNARLDDARPRGGRTAFSATLAHRVFRAHGGDLSMAPQATGGNLFTFRLPPAR